MGNQYDELARLSEMLAEAPLRKFYEEFTFVKAAGDVAGRTLLDLGCGTGVYSRRFKRRGAARVTGLDLSEPMIAIARQSEAAEPLGIEYVVQDAAAAGDVGTFDVVAGTYLLHYAPTRAALDAMCRNIRRATAPGGTFVTIVLNPEVNLRQPDYYVRYGFTMHAGADHDGAEIRFRSVIPEVPFELAVHRWSRQTYEDALRAAGFARPVWHAPEVSPEGITAFGADYWRDYLAAPHAVVLSCPG